MAGVTRSLAARRTRLVSAARSVAARRAHRQAHPLAHARLWTPICPTCRAEMTPLGSGWSCRVCGTDAVDRTSQRASLADIVNSGAIYGIVCGGNRSGKSELAAQWMVAQALGGDHPDVIAWCAHNGIDVAQFPKGPGVVWAVALSFPDSRRYVRKKLRRYCPEGTEYRAWDAENEAEARLPNGARIVCKSWTQGREGMQGDDIRALWGDEEPATSQEAVDEALVRLVDQNGRALFSFTPLSGYTWVYHRWVKAPPADVRVHTIHGADNPHIPAASLDRVLSQFGPHEQAARRRGEYTVLEGRVYSFRRDVHVVASFVPSADWPRYRAIDFGTKNPFCCLWAAWDQSDDVLHIYREHYLGGGLHGPRWHGDTINELSVGDPDVEWSVADSEDLGARLTLRDECDIVTIPAYKDIRMGINAVSERLAMDARGVPHLVIHEDCVNLIREMENYRWAPSKGSGEPEKPIKEDDHACVTGDTEIHTRAGPRPIADLADGAVHTILAWWGTPTWAPGVAKQTGTREVVKIVTDAGVLRCTPDHPLLTDHGWCPAGSLIPGDKIQRCDTMRYAHRSNHHQPDVSRIRGESLLSMRELLLEQRDQTPSAAPCGLDISVWKSATEASCSPSRRESGEQLPIESGKLTAGAAPIGAHDARTSRGVGEADCGVWSAGGEGVARNDRGAGMAPETRGRWLARTPISPAGDASLRALRLRRNESGSQEDSILLHGAQDGGIAKPAGNGDAQPANVSVGDVRNRYADWPLPPLAPEGLRAMSVARILSIRPDGVEPVYNMCVPGPSTYITGLGGLISHNCDALRYLMALHRRHYPIAFATTSEEEAG